MSESAFSMYKKRQKTKNQTSPSNIPKKIKLSKKKQNNTKRSLKSPVSSKSNDVWVESSINNVSVDESNELNISTDSEATENKDFCIKQNLNTAAFRNGDNFSVNDISYSFESVKSDPTTSSHPSHLLNISTTNVFDWLINNCDSKVFFSDYWERRILAIVRSNKNYYKKLFSTEELDKILRNNSLFYGRNVDVVSYVNGQRETHNAEGRAIPAALWDYYENGCSIRILNPHTYSTKLQKLLSSLQEYFGCMAGINAYLTPPNNQGFAPHYDDIEAFILQLEGSKHWKLYAPLNEEEVLPRFSSKNLPRSLLKDPIKEIVLKPGDLLYFPRGTIHEACTENEHSLHVTISVYQRTAYVDLLEHVFKPALEKTARENNILRQGLPINYLKHVGSCSTKKNSDVRKEIFDKVKLMMTKVIQNISIDDAADMLAKQFMHDAMPLIPSEEEQELMVHEDGERLVYGKVLNKIQFNVDTKVRLFRFHCCHAVREKEEETNQSVLRLYYCTENAKVYHGEEPQFLEIQDEHLTTLEYLKNNYPAYVSVALLPLNEDKDKILFCSDLWERGLLVTERPLKRS